MTSELMQNAPSQKDVKTLLSDLVKSGSRKRMANILGVTEGEISRRFNVNDERKLSIAEGLREWWALEGADPEASEKFESYVLGLLASWRSGNRSPKKNLSTLACDVNREVTDLMTAHLQSKPLHEQLKEAVEIGAAVNQFTEHLREEMQRASKVKEMWAKG